MRSPWRTVGALCVLLYAALPGRAKAWTEARVESARAEVRVDAEGRSDTELTLTVYVRRGWLSSLALGRLGSDAEWVDGVEPVLTPVDAPFPVYRPEVTRAEDGHVRLVFDRRGAPRRGRYRVSLHYRSTLPTSETGDELSFTLPGYEAGLAGVELIFHAPLGTTLAPDSLPEATTEVETGREGDLQLIRLRRAQVPRTVPWRVALRPPRAMADAPGASPAAPPEEPPAPRPDRRAPYALAALFGILAILRRRRFASRAERLGLRPRPLLPLPPWLRDAALVLTALGYGRALTEQPVAGLVFLTVGVALSMERVPHLLRAAKPGAFRPATIEDRQTRAGARSRLGEALDASLDATRPAGFACLLGLLAGLAWLDTMEGSSVGLASSVAFGALWLVPLFVTGNGRCLPPSMEQRLTRAEELAQALRAEGVDATAVVHQAMDGRLQDARVAVRARMAAGGLLRLQLLEAHRAGGGGVVSVPCLLVVTRPHSSADLRVRAAFPDATRWSAGGRHAYLVPAPALRAVLQTALSCLRSDAPAAPTARAA